MTAFAVIEQPIAFTGLGTWRYRTETAAPPSSGQIRFDNADISSATEFYLHETNVDGVDVSTFIDLLMTEGSTVYIQDRGDASKYVLIELGTSVDDGVYRTFQIANVLEGSGGEPSQNDEVTLIVSSGTGGAAGDVFKVGTPVDDQLGIWTGDGTLEGDANLTWDGAELLVTGPSAAAAVTVNAPNPQIRFQESDVAVDEGNWRLIANSSRWRLQTASDGAPEGGAATAFTVERTGFIVDSFDINAPIFSNTGNFDVGTEVLFTERADHVLTPAATRGILWVRNDTPNVLVFTDDAGTDWDLDPATFGDVFKVGTPVDEEFAIWTGDGTLASTPDITSDGTTMLLTPLIVRVTQNFRSRGLQDNATARRLLVFNNTTQWGAADDDEYSFARVLDTGSMGAAGGSGKTGGGNFIFRGASHSILPGDFSLRSGVAVWLNWDESAGITTFSTGIGNPKTLALTIDASQDAAFEGDVDISGDLQINEPVPTVFWNETNAPVDNRLWAMAADVGQFYIQLVNDAESAAAKVFTIDRTLNVADLFTFTGDVDVIGDVDISGTETVDSLVQPVVKIIDIGDWNMDTTASLSVAHGLTLANIRSVLVTIRNDADTLYTMLPTIDTTALSNERVEFDGTNVIMLRSLSGTFDGTDYDATSYNRGWITIQYVQ